MYKFSKWFKEKSTAQRFFLTVLLCFTFAGAAYAATSIWGSADRAPATATMRIPVDTGAASSNGYLEVQDIDTFGASSTQTLTNKTFDANGAGNALSNVETADIASGSLSGSDATLITGTAGTSGNLAQWNADGDAVDSSVATSTLVLDGEQIIALCVPLGTETGLHTTGAAKYSLRAPAAFTITDVRASLNVAATGGTLFTVDINDSGTTIISTKITIDASELTSETAATPPVVSDSAIGDDALLTFDIDAIGSTLAGEGGKVCVIGTID